MTTNNPLVASLLPAGAFLTDAPLAGTLVSHRFRRAGAMSCSAEFDGLSHDGYVGSRLLSQNDGSACGRSAGPRGALACSSARAGLLLDRVNAGRSRHTPSTAPPGRSSTRPVRPAIPLRPGRISVARYREHRRHRAGLHHRRTPRQGERTAGRVKWGHDRVRNSIRMRCWPRRGSGCWPPSSPAAAAAVAGHTVLRPGRRRYLRVDDGGPRENGEPAAGPAGGVRSHQPRRVGMGDRGGAGHADRAGSDPHGPEVEALVVYYRRAAGEHPDWEEYRAVMVSDRRVLMALRWRGSTARRSASR